MVKASYHKETFSFRFTNLSAGSASRLRGSITNIAMASRRSDVIVLDLRESTDLESLYGFLRSEDLDPKTYGVWVSVVSSSDHDGVSLPEYVVELIRRTKCGVDFSFVGLDSDDEEGNWVD
jgi:hypothetical protein